MMPRLDGFGLLAALRGDPPTVAIPVVMLSARGGEEGTLEGLEAGADDYLVKPFAARELLARVRANLELDRVRRSREQLERSQTLLDQAQRLARVGSWELDLETGSIRSSRSSAGSSGSAPRRSPSCGFPGVARGRRAPGRPRTLVRTLLPRRARRGHPVRSTAAPPGRRRD